MIRLMMIIHRVNGWKKQNQIYVKKRGKKFKILKIKI